MKVEPDYAQEPQEIPSALKVPNAETREAMEEARAKMAAWQRERDEA